MRNIKTTLSVFLCLLFFEIINRENSIFACIAAVICLQNTIVDSMEKGIERALGTVIGGLVGALVLFIVNTFYSDKVLIYIIPFGIMLLIELCVLINLKQSVVICCVVYLSIMITKSHGNGYMMYTVNRVIDTIIGIIIALLVNKYFAIPERFKSKFKSEKEISAGDLVRGDKDPEEETRKEE